MEALRADSFRTVPGLNYQTPKEVWGFLAEREEGTPLDIARSFLRANEKLLGLKRIRTKLKYRCTVPSLGADHVIFEQHYDGVRVHRAYVTVHIGKDRRVYMVKNRATPWDFLPDAVEPELDEDDAIAKAVKNRRAERRKYEKPIVEKLWYSHKGELVLSYKVRLHVTKPRHEWILYLNAMNGRVLSCHDNLAKAEAPAKIFNPNPVIALGDHERLLDEKARPVTEFPESLYQEVMLENLDGTGFLDGKHVTTAPTGKARVKSEDNRFVFYANQNGFEEAMVYFHIDHAVRYLDSLGFSGKCAIFKGPVPVNVKGTEEDGSWYSPKKKQLFFGLGGGVNDAEDAETIMHELGHAIQDAIVPDFGQSKQGAAMGEGFGDYLALSFFGEGRPERYATAVMTWDGITWEGDPPCVRNLNSGLTFESFDWSDKDVMHQNGQIWGETLMEIWHEVGREVADTIIVESHYQLDGFSTFARGARAIIDADRNVYNGTHRDVLLDIFRRRGIGPVE